MKYVEVRDNLADYWHRLSPEEKDWLRKFESEYGGHASKTKTGKDRILKPSQIREAWGARNAKRRDVFYQHKSLILLADLEPKDNVETES